MDQVDTRVSAAPCQVIRAMPVEGLTLRELLERLGVRGLLILCMILTMPFLLPVSIPGSSIPFGAIIALHGAGIVTHRAPWLPERLMNRRLFVLAMLAVDLGVFHRQAHTVQSSPKLPLLPCGMKSTLRPLNQFEEQQLLGWGQTWASPPARSGTVNHQ